MEDMKMMVYDKDSSAVAVVLVDYGKAYISIGVSNASLVYDRHYRIKVLKNGGLEYATRSIPLYHAGSTEERVSNLKAVAYNLENGKIAESKLNKEGIFKERFNRNINLQKFTLSNVKVGSIIEVSYTINSDFVTNFPNWQFQELIPCRHSEYHALIPDFFVMEKYMQGYLAVSDYQTKDESAVGYSIKHHAWKLKDVPAFKVEPYMTSETDYLSKINFALAYINFPGQPSQEVMGSWEKLNRSLLEDDNFGRVIAGSNYLKKITEDLITGETEPMKKIEKIFTYVKSNIEWDGWEDYLADKPKETLEKKKGSSGDINLTLASMLEKAGFLVDMVLVSTREHGFVRPQYPMSRQFNYVVVAVRVDGKPIFLDATERYLPVGVLPERCLNGQGLIISKQFHGWIDLATKMKARAVVNADLYIQDETLTGKLTYSHDGYKGIRMRKEYKNQGEAEYVKDFKNEHPNWEVSNIMFENVEDITKSAKQSFDVTINNHITENGDVLYLNPFVATQMEQNPFRLADRVYPVDYGSAQESVYMCKINVPDVYAIDELPKSKVMALPENAGRYTYNVTTVGNTISITSNFVISRNIFTQAEYANLREFYAQVIAKMSEQIVLKKKT